MNDSYLNQVPPNVTQYPPDSMFAPGAPHGQTAPYKSNYKPRTWLDSLKTLIITVIVMFLTALVSAIIMVVGQENARKYNAVPDNEGDGSTLYHYPYSRVPKCVRRVNQAFWSIFAAMPLTLVTSVGITFLIIILVGYSMLNGGLSLDTWESGPFLIFSLAFLAVLPFYFMPEWEAATRDNPKDWKAFQEQCARNPLKYIPVTDLDARLCGWKSVAEYTALCERIIVQLKEKGMNTSYYNDWKLKNYDANGLRPYLFDNQPFRSGIGTIMTLFSGKNAYIDFKGMRPEFVPQPMPKPLDEAGNPIMINGCEVIRMQDEGYDGDLAVPVLKMSGRKTTL